MGKDLLLENVRSAKKEVVDAEKQIEKLLRELQRNARAEKTTISNVLEAAFDKLRAARQHLATAETLAAAGDH